MLYSSATGVLINKGNFLNKFKNTNFVNNNKQKDIALSNSSALSEAEESGWEFQDEDNNDDDNNNDGDDDTTSEQISASRKFPSTETCSWNSIAANTTNTNTNMIPASPENMGTSGSSKGSYKTPSTNMYIVARASVLLKKFSRHSTNMLMKEPVYKPLQNSVLSPLKEGWLYIRDCSIDFRYSNPNEWLLRYCILIEDVDSSSEPILFYFPSIEV